MKQRLISLAAGAALIAGAAGTASAQMAWTPGSEIVGQTLQVQTNGVTNSVYLGPNGNATITTAGGKTVPATWSAAGGQLCMSTGGPQECWPYTQAFRAGQQVALTSNCQSSSTFLATSTNPMQQAAGERG
jgi:hypothetical protein